MDASEKTKNYVTAAAIIIGGIWALLKFSALLQPQIASAQYEKLKLEIKTQPNISVKLCANHNPQAPKNSAVTIKLENEGNATSIINFEAGPFFIAEYLPGQYQEPVRVHVRELFSYSRSTIEDETFSKVAFLKLDPAENRTFTIPADLSSPNRLFHIEFAGKASTSQETIKTLKDAGLDGTPESRHIVVGSSLVVASSEHQAPPCR